MKSVLSLLALAGVAVMSGCASSPSVPAGMQAGKFVSYECEGGKRLQARLAADGSTVRIRHEGGYELDRKGNGCFQRGVIRAAIRSGMREWGIRRRSAMAAVRLKQRDPVRGVRYRPRCA